MRKISLAIAVTSMLVPLGSHADDCYVMLKPIFDFATAIEAGVIHRVYTTVTKHYAFGPKYPSTPANVWYTRGELTDHQEFWGSGPFKILAETLYNTSLETRSNKSKNASMDTLAVSRAARTK